LTAADATQNSFICSDSASDEQHAQKNLGRAPAPNPDLMALKPIKKCVKEHKT
jgi:hypothetical protein